MMALMAETRQINISKEIGTVDGIQTEIKQYRKILKISPRAYIFQRPFLRGLFLEGLIFGGAYLRREICVSKSIGLALQLEGNLPFLLCFTLYLRAISKYKPLGGLYLEGRFNEGFFALQVQGAYIWRGLYMDGIIFGILRYVFCNLWKETTSDYISQPLRVILF